jgi:hypothetical protein
MRAHASLVASSPTNVYFSSAPFHPTKRHKSLLQRGDASLPFRSVGDTHQDADAPHPLGLPARCGRPRSGRTAEQRDELASSHCPMPPVLPTERITHLNYGRRLLRCGISVPLMSATGSNPDFLLGGRTSASVECRHWSGRAVRWSTAHDGQAQLGRAGDVAVPLVEGDAHLQPLLGFLAHRA